MGYASAHKHIARPVPPPAALFDPRLGGQPPPSAVEIYLEAPLSAGALYQAAAIAGDERIMAAVEAARDAAMDSVLACLFECALLKVGYHSRQRTSQWTVGEYLPGQLAITRVEHVWATDAGRVTHDDIARLHDHIYLGATGVLPRDQQRWPVDLYSARRASTQMRPRYAFQFEQSLTASLGVAWGPRGADPEPVREIVRPMMPGFVHVPELSRYVPGYPRVLCRDGYRLDDRWNVQDIAHPAPFDPDAS